MRNAILVALLAICSDIMAADEVSLRLGGKELSLDVPLRAKLAVLAKETLRRCGPNTTQHPGNFGLAAFGAGSRWNELLQGSRLRVRFAEPFASESQLGGTLGVSEALIGLEHKDFFVGPNLTRHGDAVAEHLQCGYLPQLELACLAELEPHLPPRYLETCARLGRDAQGRIVMPPPDIAPSCS